MLLLDGVYVSRGERLSNCSLRCSTSYFPVVVRFQRLKARARAELGALIEQVSERVGLCL